MKKLLRYIDDVLLFLGLMSIVTASYMVSAVLGTYVLGAAFLAIALLLGKIRL
jgi:hypothetical protein